MNARIMLVVAAFAMIGTEYVVAQDEFAPKVGDHVVIRLRNRVAMEYTRMKGEHEGSATLSSEFVCDTIATITQILPDGQVELEQSSAVVIKNGVTRMLTLSATVDPKVKATNITVRRIPAGTLIYFLPKDRQPIESQATKAELTMTEIDLSNAKVELRSWVLADELKFNQ